jgi:hypothetical protein
MAKPGTQTTCNVTVTVSHFAKGKTCVLAGDLVTRAACFSSGEWDPRALLLMTPSPLVLGCPLVYRAWEKVRVSKAKSKDGNWRSTDHWWEGRWLFSLRRLLGTEALARVPEKQVDLNHHTGEAIPLYHK